jgi:hypothetical protein
LELLLQEKQAGEESSEDDFTRYHGIHLTKFQIDENQPRERYKFNANQSRK